ncbi:MAG: type VI secretion system-associated protein TagF [Novosphingobium sp.]
MTEGTLGSGGGGATPAALAEVRLPQAPWLFGKLPAHGDFLARGLAGDLREALDNWISAGVAGARTRFADHFEQRYFAAPPWHFVDRGPDGQWTGGALCPSVDGVGRKFPILLATPAPGPEQALGAARVAVDLACAAISQGWDAGRLHTELGAAIAASATGEDIRTGWAIDADDGSHLAFPGRFPDGLVERMLEIAG